MVLGLVQVTRQLEQVMSDVVAHHAGKVSSGEDSSDPALKSGDVLLHVGAIVGQSLHTLECEQELSHTSEPLTVPEILESVANHSSLSLAITEASLNLGEALLVEDAVDDAHEHHVVLSGGQLADGLLEKWAGGLDVVNGLHFYLGWFLYLITIARKAI